MLEVLGRFWGVPRDLNSERIDLLKIFLLAAGNILIEQDMD
jgi:hypothetical protein